MSQITRNLKQIEDLLVDQLADALEMNGYAKCGGVIRTKHIDGQAFLKLTELQLSLWRLPNIEARRLWSFIQQIKQDPTQFITNSQISSNKPKVNKLNKPSITERTMYGNLTVNSNFSNIKPNIVSKPYRFQKPVQTNETTKEKCSPLTKQESKVFDKTEKPQEIKETKEEGELFKDKIEKTQTTEVNSSTLTKQESKLLKNQLESLFKTNEPPNNSFVHNQKPPFLPPKPDHLIVNVSEQNNRDESPDDYIDGYLAPINRVKEDPTPDSVRTPSAISRNDTTRSSFLHRQRRNYDNLEIRPEVIPNDYEEQKTKQKVIVQNRPLPPVPVESKKNPPPTLDTDDEELAEYTAVPDHEEPKIKNDVKRKQHRPLPPVPQDQVSMINQLPEMPRNHQQLNNPEDDEELVEYTPVMDDDEPQGKVALPQPIIKTSRSPLPPLHIPIKPKVKERAKLPTPESDKEEILSKQQEISMHGLKSSQVPFKSPINRALATLPTRNTSKMLNFESFSANLPKPPTNLPAPPIALVSSSSNFLNNLRQEQTDLAENKPEDKRMSASPIPEARCASNDMVDEIDEQSFYTDIDLAREPCYRETDRKGARRLLAGLDNGAFVIRPSRQSQYICTISIMHSRRMFNLGIERNPQGALAFGSVAPDFDQPQFYSVSEIINYYSLHPLCLSGESILLKDSLPRNKY